MSAFVLILCVFAVYDITKRSSFLSLQRWIEEVRRYTATNVLLILVGNKSDMESLREVEFVEAEAICEYLPEVLYVMETSAKDNKGVDEAFTLLATELKVCMFEVLSEEKTNYILVYY
jgi:Ras-related protein Rab-43